MAFFEIDTSKNDYDVDGFCLKCEKCKKDANFELVITDLQGVEL